MRITGVLLVLALLLVFAGCSSPRGTTDDQPRQDVRIEQLSQQVQDLQGQVNALRAQAETDRAYLQGQLTIAQDAYAQLWDSYNSVMDYLIAQSERRMMEAPEP